MWDSVTDLIGVHLCRLAGVDANRAGKLYIFFVSYSLTRCVRRRRRTSTRVPGPTTPTPAILCWRSPDPAASSGWSTTSQCNASRWRSRLLGARTRSLQAPCTVFSFSIINVNTPGGGGKLSTFYLFRLCFPNLSLVGENQIDDVFKKAFSYWPESTFKPPLLTPALCRSWKRHQWAQVSSQGSKSPSVCQQR